MRTLIEKGANVNTKNSINNSALIVAASTGTIEQAPND